MSPLLKGGALRAAARSCLADGMMPAETLARAVLGFPRIDPRLADHLLGTLLGDDPAFERSDGRWRLRPPLPVPPPCRLAEASFVVVDVETTGGRPPGDRIIEIGAVRIRGGRIDAEWSTLVNPGRALSRFVVGLTGIEDAMVERAPRFGAVADGFVGFLGAATFVAHNAIFDWRFLNAELLHASGGTLTNPRLCTVRLARRLLPHVRRRNLDALAHLFGVPIEGRHRALGDARATARILLRLLEVAGEQGVETEADLATLAGAAGNPAAAGAVLASA